MTLRLDEGPTGPHFEVKLPAAGESEAENKLPDNGADEKDNAIPAEASKAGYVN